MSSQILSKPLPYVALLIAHLIWGANFVVAKVTLQEFPPMSLAFLRFGLAIILITPFFLAERKKIKVDRKDLPGLIGVGVLIITLNVAFFFEGIVRTTAINASVLTLIIPALSVLFGWAFLKEKIFIINLVGIAIGILGALVLIKLPEILLGEIPGKEIIGNLLIILASICWVLGSVFARKLLKKYSSLLVTAIAFLVGTITFALPALKEYIQNPEWVNNITMLGFFGLLYMTLLSSISAYLLFEWGLSQTSVNKANLFHYVEPFIAALLAITILSEKITPPFIFGSILIVAGVYLGTLGKELHHRAGKTHRL